MDNRGNDRKMRMDLRCPDCKAELVLESDYYLCTVCKKSYQIKDGFVDFIGKDFYAGEIPRNEFMQLLTDIDHSGYDKALQVFFQKYPLLQEYITDTSRGDWQCHGVGKDYARCLDIGSGLGNVSEILSSNFKEVYSLEAVTERIEFQKRRYRNSNKNNIVLIRGNAVQLPFPENFFDFVVCNGVLEWVAILNTTLKPREAQISFLSEIKRVLSPNGCAYIGIENRFGLPFFLGALDHSGLKFTSLLPRWLATIFVKRFGTAGGIYGDANSLKETRGYVTYTYSLAGYQRLFKEVGFKTKSFWVVPSYNEPRISGRTEDSNALKGYIGYFLNTSKKFRIPISILSKFNKSIIRAIGCLLAPSFLFYCYKDQIAETFDDSVMSKTNLASFVSISTGRGVMYMVFDDRAHVSSIVHIERPQYRPKGEIPLRDKSKIGVNTPKKDAWMEEWINGTQLDPLNIKESQLALRWLFNYQRKNSFSEFSEHKIKAQVSDLRRLFALIPHVKASQYEHIFDNYESYVCKLHIIKSSEHGDFFYSNIVVNKSKSNVHVIDWEYYRENGDPLFDLAFYILTALQLPTSSAHDFENNLRGNGKFINVLKELKPMIDEHYGCKVNLDKLIPYTVIRFYIRKYFERGKFDSTVNQYGQLLDIVMSKNFRLNI